MGMTSAAEFRQAARVAKHNDGLEALARLGFIGFGLTHLVLAWIAVQLAFGRAPADGDQLGAFQLLRHAPLGVLLLALVAIGLAATAVWQALEAAVGHTDVRGATRVGERLASVGRTLAYGFFAVSALKLLFRPTTGGAGEKQAAAGSLLDAPGGPWLVGLIGIGVVVTGGGLVWYGATRHFERHLKTGQMTEPTRHTVGLLGVIGYVAKGVAYAIAGVLVVTAAVHYDPSAARGLDASLRALTQSTWGVWLLFAMAAGIAAYGLFAIAQARYRRV